MNELAEKARPAVEKYGTPAQRNAIFQGLLLTALRRDRYVVSEETMAHARSSLEAIRESGNLSAIALAQFMFGFSYLWRDELGEADEHLQAALKLAESIGDVVVQSRCLTYLTILHRKSGEIEEVQHYISRALGVATAGKMLEYISTAKANLAWVKWRQGNFSEAKENGRKALEMWQQEPLIYPFQWTALWPMIGVALAQGKVSEAVDYACALLESSQQRLPDSLNAFLKQAIKDLGEGKTAKARNNLNRAVDLAHDLGCF
jgi:tetratricopeptide (TPR) repeat protein